MKEITFCALEPPGNIQKPFFNLQEELFRTWGLASSRLLPPLIPLALGPLTAEARGRIREVLLGMEEMQTATDPVVIGGAVIVPLSGYCASVLQAFVRELNIPAVGGADEAACALVPGTPGVWLSCSPGSGGTGGLDGGRAMKPVTPLPAQRWKRMHVVEIALHFPSDIQFGRAGEWEFLSREKAACGGAIRRV